MTCLAGIFLGNLVLLTLAHAQDSAAVLAARIPVHEALPEPELLTRQELLRDSVLYAPKLSPDGNYLVYGEVEGLQLNLNLLHTTSGEHTTLLNTNRLAKVFWSHDSRSLILELDNAVAQLDLSDPAHARYLTRLDRKLGDHLAGVVLNTPVRLLVSRFEDEERVLFEVSEEGGQKELYRSEWRIDGALQSADGRALFVRLTTEENFRIIALVDGVETELVRCAVMDFFCGMDAFDDSSQMLWLRHSRSTELLSLYRWSVQTQTSVPAHSDPQQTFDLNFIHYLNNKPVLAQYQDTQLRNEPLDADYAAALQRLEAEFPNSDITPYFSNGSYWLVEEQGPRLIHSRYYLYDVNAQTLKRLFADKEVGTPRPEQLNDKIFIQYPASDDMLLYGQVSLPTGKPLHEAPLITLVHGGPSGRVVRNYDATVQLLVNRGYIVFEPNFRASTGFGLHYALSANRDFGNGRVQQDILDGIDWLLEQGLGARDRLGIAGASFGGFAVLTGLTFSPELFKAGVAIVPPASMGAALRYQTTKQNNRFRNPIQDTALRSLLGDLDDAVQMQALYEKSPQAHLDNIERPLLIMAGADDDRVDIRHVRNYASQLLQQGKALTLFIDEDEGHGFLSDEVSEVSLYLMEAFFAQYLQGRQQSLDDSALQQYLQDKLQANTNVGFLEESGAL